jgi:hypothetical protein
MLVLRYIQFKSAGGKYIGRSVLGHSWLKDEFAESCPYFNFRECIEDEKETDDWIRCRMPVGGKNVDTFCLFNVYIAPFIFHMQWLEVNIHSANLLR